MCNNWKMCENEKSGRGRPGRGVVLEIRTHPDKERGVVWKSEILADVLCRRPQRGTLKKSVYNLLAEISNIFVSFIIKSLAKFLEVANLSGRLYGQYEQPKLKDQPTILEEWYKEA